MKPDETPDDLYDQWIRPHESKLASSAWRILRSEQETADVLQDAMTRIWKHRQTLVQHPNPVAWMLRIVLNATYDHLRCNPIQPTDLSSVDEIPAKQADGRHEGPLMLQESRSRVLQELMKLSPQQAEAVMLRLVEGLPYEDVAKAMECSPATVRVHVNRGREKLRLRLTDLDPCSGETP